MRVLRVPSQFRQIIADPPKTVYSEQVSAPAPRPAAAAAAQARRPSPPTSPRFHAMSFLESPGALEAFRLRLIRDVNIRFEEFVSLLDPDFIASLAPAPVAEKPVDVSRSADDWLADLMLPETKAMLQKRYGHREFLCRGMIQFFVTEDLIFWPDDEVMESHGKASSGAQRMEPCWHRRLNVALCKGQSVPGFPLQKVKGTKDKFKLIIATP